jgi:L-threonylcarbamoyladenylate synthase
VRAPSHPVARDLIRALGGPIAAPSANRHQHLSATTAAHVVKQLGDCVDLVLDAGPCEAGIESTVVDVRQGVAKVLRPGAVSLTELRAVLPHVSVRTQEPPAGEPRASPGMGARHYAPRAPMLLADTIAMAERIVRTLSSQRTRAGVVVYEEAAQRQWPEDCLVRVLARVPSDYAHALYATLHELDECGVGAIVVVRVPEGDDWWAIADRLERGAA